MSAKHTDGRGHMPAGPRALFWAAGLSCCLLASGAVAQPAGAPAPPAVPSTLPYEPVTTGTVLVEDAPGEGPTTSRVIAPRLYDLPDMIGDFFARGSVAHTNTGPLNVALGFSSAGPVAPFAGGGAPLAFNGVRYLGPGGFAFNSLGNGAIGVQPSTILSALPGNAITLDTTTANVIALRENAQVTQAVRAAFPGATFINGTGTYLYTNQPGAPAAPVRPPGPFDFFQNVFIYQYTDLVGGQVGVLVSNPVGGGLAGRNRYFENGSAVPRDRVYFYYSGVSDFSAPGRSFNVNRYTMGGEMTFLGGRGSLEARLPMAGTLSSDQNTIGPANTNHYELGNLGLLAKYALVATPNFILTGGLGLSTPTADDTRLRGTDGKTLLEIANQTTLVQPIVGFAWVPTESLFFQGGAQLDIDPSGNSVYTRQDNGSLRQAGTLTDQTYGYLHGGVGYTLYRGANQNATLSAVSLLGELHYTQAMGRRDAVQSGAFRVSDINQQINALNATVGVNCLLSNRASLSAGVVMPWGGTKLYDWAAQAQINWRFGAP